MTPLKKPVIRLSTDTLGRFGRPLVVILGPGSLISFREHGCRKTFTTTIGACASMAIKRAVFLERMERAAAKKAKQEGRKKR